jgi:energy-coupling factor transport system permease protein
MPARPSADPTAAGWARALTDNRRFASPIHALNPFTTVVLGGAALVLALSLPTIVGALLLALVLGALAVAARSLGRLGRPALIAAAVVLVLTWLISLASGGSALDAARGASDGALRVVAIVLGLGLVATTVVPAALGLDLERRGVSRRLATAAVAGLGWGPGLARRLEAISAAQRARGLRLARNPLTRLQRSAPILLPALVTSLGGLSERTIALESRASGHPGRRSLLWAPADPTAERVLRWLVLVVAGLSLVIRIAARAG